MDDIAVLYEEYLNFPDIPDESIDHEGSVAPCVKSYGRGRVGDVRTKPRLPNSALLLTVKFRARKAWMTRAIDQTVDKDCEKDDLSGEVYRSGEMLVEEALRATQPQRKSRLTSRSKGRGRAKALAPPPDYLQPPGGLYQKFASQPKLPVSRSPKDLFVGDSAAYSSKWEDADTLRRPTSVPNLSVNIDNQSEFPPLRREKKAPRVEHIDDIMGPPQAFPKRRKLPSQQEHREYLEKQMRKRMNVKNWEPGVYDSNEIPPSEVEDTLTSGEEKTDTAEQSYNQTHTQSEGNISLDTVSQKMSATCSRYSSEPSLLVCADQSSQEGSMLDLDCPFDDIPNELQDFYSEPSETNQLPRTSNSIPECVTRTLQFYLNSAQSHNKRLDKKIEDFTESCITNQQISEQLHPSVTCDSVSNIDTGSAVDCADKDFILEKSCDNLDVDGFNSDQCDFRKSKSENELRAADDRVLAAPVIPLGFERQSGTPVGSGHMGLSDFKVPTTKAVEKHGSSCTVSSSAATSASSDSESVSVAGSSSESLSHVVHGPSQRVFNCDGFTLVLDWRMQGAHQIQLEGLPLNADLSVVEQLVASYGKLLGREVKWADQQKIVRYKLDSADACDFAVECLHDTDCLYPDSSSVLVCSRV